MCRVNDVQSMHALRYYHEWCERFFAQKSILVTSYNYGWMTDITWTFLTMSLQRLWALNVVVALRSMEGQKALGCLPKYLILCSEDEQRSNGFGTTLGWVINYRIFISIYPFKTNILIDMLFNII